MVEIKKDMTIEDLARLVADGFTNTPTKADFDVLKADVGVLKSDVAILKDDVARIDKRLVMVEKKLDTALYHELDLHEKWIKQLATKVGVELARQI